LNVKVRFGTRDDIDALVEVNCSDVETWYHYSSEGRGDPASYDELNSWERVMHGGPWMDRSALIEYWKRMERLNIISLVAELEGKVVGHLDAIFSEEFPLGYFLYLDVLMVHKAYRRKGVARTLIKEAEKLAKSRKAKFMLVQPEEYEGPSGLTYRSCGFKKFLEVYVLETTTDVSKMPQDVCLTTIPQTQEAPLKTHTMICGWYNISVKMWDHGVNPYIELSRVFSCPQLALCVLTSEETYFFHIRRDYFNRLRGSITLWAPIPFNEKNLEHVFSAAKVVASWLGIKHLTTRTIEKYKDLLEEAGFVLKSKAEPYLAKNLQ